MLGSQIKGRPLLVLALWSVPIVVGADEPVAVEGRVFYVRQTVGDDFNDGRTPDTAWRSLSKLGHALRAGDTAFVGPGLYRDQLILSHSGTATHRISLVADATGRNTGDPPGVVMIAGSDPVDEQRFARHDALGVFAASLDGPPVLGVVEMDGPQETYVSATDTSRHRFGEIEPLLVVAQLASSFFFDADANTLYLHTSDGRHPADHEIELIRRSGGVIVNSEDYVTIVGFTIRHARYAGISFGIDSVHGVATGNTCYGGHQGISVRSARHVLVAGNTLFGNDNSGVYFLSESTDGSAVGNVCYGNVKGIRWGSRSDGGLAADNLLFDNAEAGISIESTQGLRVVGNRLVGNHEAQLNAIESDFHSEGNCFQLDAADQLVARENHKNLYPTLAAYREAARRDLGSREGSCGALPQKLDVHRLHAETVGYASRARSGR